MTPHQGRVLGFTLAKATRTCTIIVVLTLALSSANADDLMRQRTTEQAAATHHSVDADTALRDHWLSTGAGEGPLGSPTTNAYPVGNGRVQEFQRGVIYWSPSTAWHTTTGGNIERRYIALGGPAGPLGFPKGEETAAGTTRVQQFSGGYLVQSPTGVRIVNPETYKAWAKNRKLFNWPVKDSWQDARGVHTGFQATETIWDPQTKALYSTATVDENTAIIIGDSQLNGDSWTEQGARAAGFSKKIELGFGGWGYSRATRATQGTPDEVFATHRMLLPQGNPGVIFVTLGGNDATAQASDADIIAHATKTWAELRRLYPKTPIIVNGVMSTDAARHAKRRHLDQVITDAAGSQGFIHVSVAGMATTASADYKDNVHLTQAGQNLVAVIYVQALLKALKLQAFKLPTLNK